MLKQQQVTQHYGLYFFYYLPLGLTSQHFFNTKIKLCACLFASGYKWEAYPIMEFQPAKHPIEKKGQSSSNECK